MLTKVQALGVAAGVGAAVAAYYYYTKASCCAKAAAPCSKAASTCATSAKAACGACPCATTSPFTTLENAKGEKVNAAEALKGKVVALYYSAHWCPPCRAFTPILHALYDDVNDDEKVFEVIFVSSDDSAAGMDKYMADMHGDWLRVPYDDPLRQGMKKKFGVFAGKEAEGFPGVKRRCGIPGLLLIKPDGSEGKLLDCEGDGLALIKKLGGGVLKEWEQYKW